MLRMCLSVLIHDIKQHKNLINTFVNVPDYCYCSRYGKFSTFNDRHT